MQAYDAEAMWFNPTDRRMLQDLIWSARHIHRVLHKLETEIMASLDEIRASVAAQNTVTQSVVTMLVDINQRLKDAMADDDPEALRQLARDIDSNTATLAAAVAANTRVPTEPAPVVPEPTPVP